MMACRVLTHARLHMLPESRLGVGDPRDGRSSEVRKALLLCLMAPALKKKQKKNKNLLLAT